MPATSRLPPTTDATSIYDAVDQAVQAWCRLRVVADTVATVRIHVPGALRLDEERAHRACHPDRQGRIGGLGINSGRDPALIPFHLSPSRGILRTPALQFSDLINDETSPDYPTRVTSPIKIESAGSPPQTRQSALVWRLRGVVQTAGMANKKVSSLPKPF